MCGVCVCVRRAIAIGWDELCMDELLRLICIHLEKKKENGVSADWSLESLLSTIEQNILELSRRQ